MKINAENQDFETLNGQIRSAAGKEIEIENCLGHRYIGCGLSDKKITVNGISGNALGAYLNGGELILNGNAQDAVGDTMNAGKIVIHGNVGDTVGYAMRGGEIYVQGDAGYRAGIHMKAYKEKKARACNRRKSRELFRRVSGGWCNYCVEYAKGDETRLVFSLYGYARRKGVYPFGL